MIANNKTNVLLPGWLLRKRSALSDESFLVEAKKYLERYPDYQLLYVDNNFAVCNRAERGETSGKKNKNGSYKRRAR
jgi:hypothetical protein